MLSAHQPFERFPAIIREAVREAGGVAQFAGGVPAMCDGITQGQTGMELSLFSRDAIAMGTAVALSHNMFDAALCLGVCDKIVPGLLIGALHFGHLPGIFVPAGPMTSGMSNPEKAKVRQLYAQGKVGRAELLEAEAKSYHDVGTCTFYGTANSNQMLMEVMGLHLPGAAFVTPNTPLRDALTAAAGRHAVEIGQRGNAAFAPIGRVVDEKSIVNAVIALLATGGSTNHTLHLVAIAKAAGIVIDWTDFDELSAVIPLLTRIYPNGDADVNHFHAAGGYAFRDTRIARCRLAARRRQHHHGQSACALIAPNRSCVAKRSAGRRQRRQTAATTNVLRKAANPFSADGGLRLLTGNLGRSVIQGLGGQAGTPHRARAGHCVQFAGRLPESLQGRRTRPRLRRRAALPGPARQRHAGIALADACSLRTCRDAGRHVALVTDGRMSGASGKVPAAIHVSPEVLAGGPLGLVRDGTRT